MADTPEVPMDNEQLESELAVDPSHELDLETVYSSIGVEAEMEALAIQSVLEANGIPTVLEGSSTLPNLPFSVKVPREHVETAMQRIKEAQAAGPSAAEEAELAGESQQAGN
ncbi:MAG: hypothetical protein IT167_03420 [Bryobacterales bacterium]|nr:hypothetical protein [Bryobacterales bacterium]